MHIAYPTGSNILKKVQFRYLGRIIIIFPQSQCFLLFSNQAAPIEGGFWSEAKISKTLICSYPTIVKKKLLTNFDTPKN